MAQARSYTFVTREWMERQTPSQRDGMFVEKEELLLCEAAELVSQAAELFKTCVLRWARPRAP